MRWTGIATGALLLLFGLAWLAVPPILKSQAEQRLSALLGRDVTIGRVTFLPWSLELTVEQFRIEAAAPAASTTKGAPLFSVERLHVNADLRSLLRLAPVVENVDIEGPKLRLTRLADGRYDIEDLLTRFKRDTPAPPDDKSARFALHNLRLNGGSVEFDDRPVQRLHRVQGLQLSLPFLSNLPADVAITVEPRLAFTLDGAAFDSGAHAKPFAQDRASQLELRIAELNLAPWLPYLPAGLPLRPSHGVFAAQLQIQFALPPGGGTPQVSIKGQTTLRDVALVTGAGVGEPLAAWKHLQVGLADVQPLARRGGLGKVMLDGARLEVQRAADGSLNLLPANAKSASASSPVASPPASAASAPKGANANEAWVVSAEQIALTDARIDWRDATTQPAVALRADALELSLQRLRWPFEAPAALKLAGRIGPVDAADAATFTIDGEATDRLVKVVLDVRAVDLRWLAPYLAQSLVPSLDGRIALASTVDWAAGETPRLALSKVNASATDLRLIESAPRGAKAAPRKTTPAPAAVAVASFSITDSSVDLIARRVLLGTVKVERPALRIHRNREGQWNALAWVRAAANDKAAQTPDWQVQLGEAQLSGGELRQHDEHPSAVAGSAAEPVRLMATGINANVRHLHWPGAARH